MSGRWMRLDNAALIFPAIRHQKWVNTFRLSVTLKEAVDPLTLQKAADDLRPRFPSIYVRLGTGVFWYFLEQLDAAPRVMQDFAYPLTHMSKAEQGRCCFRVLYYKNRIAVEFFHALTDGTGGLVFLKTLAARYLELRHAITVPKGGGVLDVGEKPPVWELEDAFHKCTGEYAMSRSEENAYRLTGTHDPTGFMHLTTGIVKTGDLLAAAHANNATVTAFVSAVMAQTIIEMQACHVRRAKWRPVKITVPVNLRNVFRTDTMRNFALVLNIGVDPRLKDYSIAELCREYKNQMSLEVTPEKMAARIAANVIPQRLVVMRAAPLFLKNIALRTVYSLVGECKGCLNISNLGQVRVPAEMEPYIERFEFIIGVQYTYPNNCSVASFGETTCINMIRNIRETELERRFFSKLVSLGIPVLIESNDPKGEAG